MNSGARIRGVQGSVCIPVSVLLGIYREVELLDHTVILCVTFLSDIPFLTVCLLNLEDCSHTTPKQGVCSLWSSHPIIYMRGGRMERSLEMSGCQEHRVKVASPGAPRSQNCLCRVPRRCGKGRFAMEEPRCVA